MLKAKDYNIFSKYLYMKLIFLLKMLLQNIYNQMTAFFQSNLPISSKKLLDPFLKVESLPSKKKKKICAGHFGIFLLLVRHLKTY